MDLGIGIANASETESQINKNISDIKSFIVLFWIDFFTKANGSVLLPPQLFVPDPWAPTPKTNSTPSLSSPNGPGQNMPRISPMPLPNGDPGAVPAPTQKEFDKINKEKISF